MRRYDEPIRVSTNRGQPTRITWRGKVYRVTGVNDRWRICTNWWHNEQKRSYYRVAVSAAHNAQQSEMQIYSGPGGWVLSGVYD